jgi:hypothetical protein
MTATITPTELHDRLDETGLAPTEVVAYLDLDGDGVLDAVRTTRVTPLTPAEGMANEAAYVVETVTTGIDDDGNAADTRVHEWLELDRPLDAP